MTTNRLAAVPIARHSSDLVVLEGFHAIKHAIRFGADILGIWTSDPDEVEDLRQRLAPDLEILAEAVDPRSFKAVAPRTSMVAVARRPAEPNPKTMLAHGGDLVLLEDPRRLSNVGAVIRVAAAAGAAGVVTLGGPDPWHPDALRGSAGLHFALPVLRTDELDTGPHPVVAMDPDGEPLDPTGFPETAVLAFGTERDGLSEELLAQADMRVALPMMPGVSSLNLATAVAATLYALSLA